jgi:hypothetical protein
MKLRTFLFLTPILLSAVTVQAQKYDAATLTGLTPDSGSLPLWSQPDGASRAALGQFARDCERGIFIAGSAETTHGTAWCISKKHRLLVTNAHVADLFHQGKGEMFAIPSGTSQVHRVARVLYHPGVRRWFKGNSEISIRSTDPTEGDIDPMSPDVAILELDADGPELTVEFLPATEAELRTLFAQPAAIYGFPGYDNEDWPKLGSKPAATFHDGVVSRIADFHLDPGAPFEELQNVQYTMTTWGGFSGSPVFLPNGRVCAIHNMGRKVKSGEVVQSMPHGIRVDCLLELLVHHKLEDRVPFAVEKKLVNVERWLQPDPRGDKVRADYAKARQLVKEAYNLIFIKEDYKLGVEKCDEAIALAPQMAIAHNRRAMGFFNYHFDFRDRLSNAEREKLLRQAEVSFRAAMKLEPTNAYYVIDFAKLHNTFGVLWGDDEQHSKALSIVTEMIDKGNLNEYALPSAISTRAVARANLGDREAARRDHDEAVRIAPPYSLPAILETRASFLEARGENAAARADRARAKELRSKLK